MKKGDFERSKSALFAFLRLLAKVIIQWLNCSWESEKLLSRGLAALLLPFPSMKWHIMKFNANDILNLVSM